VTQQEIFDRTVEVERHIKHLPAEARIPISALISWSAFNAGMARTGVGLVSKLATTTGWEELQTVLGLDSYGVTEAGALSLTAAQVTTSIDLAAAAALRLAGARPESREFSMSTFTSTDRRDRKLVAAHPLTAALDTWATAVRASPEWDLLKKCRNQLVHRTTPRHVYLTTRRPGPLPSSEVAIDGRNHAIDALVHEFSAFGEARFDQFCDAAQTDFPDQG
jgi:hypothetical protein